MFVSLLNSLWFLSLFIRLFFCLQFCDQFLVFDFFLDTGFALFESFFSCLHAGYGCRTLLCLLLLLWGCLLFDRCSILFLRLGFLLLLSSFLFEGFKTSLLHHSLMFGQLVFGGCWALLLNLVLCFLLAYLGCLLLNPGLLLHSCCLSLRIVSILKECIGSVTGSLGFL